MRQRNSFCAGPCAWIIGSPRGRPGLGFCAAPESPPRRPASQNGRRRGTNCVADARVPRGLYSVSLSGPWTLLCPAQQRVIRRNNALERSSHILPIDRHGFASHPINTPRAGSR